MAFSTTLAVLAPTPAWRAWARQRAAAEATSSRIAWASRSEMPAGLRQFQQVAARRRAPFSGDGHGVLTSWAGRENEIVGGRQLPVAFVGHTEGEVFHVIVPVVRQHVEDHPTVAFQNVLVISGQDPRHLEELAVVAARDAEVGVDQITEGVHVEAAVALAIKPLDPEEPFSLRPSRRAGWAALRFPLLSP